MLGNIDRKVLGSVVIGLALVAGAYTLGDFGVDQISVQTAQVQQAQPVFTRNAVEVLDVDNNGIEDWKDDFVTSEPIIIDATTTEYIPPDTITGQMGVDFIEGIISSRIYAPFAPSEDEVIQRTVDTVAGSISYELYDTPDAIIMRDWVTEDIKNYANAMAGAITRNDIPEMDNELTILYDVLDRGRKERVVELEILAGVYRQTRDDSLAVPVPDIFLKQHLDLINTYHSLYRDITAMAMADDDPAFTLLHIKRYQDDALGLRFALENMYTALLPYAEEFTVNDPAIFFTLFSPNNQMQ